MALTNNASFVGMFTLEGNTIDIADPYLSAMTSMIDKIPIGNERIVTVRNCIGGTYNIYHLCDDYGKLQFLCAIHNTYDIKTINEYENEFMGHISSSLSGEVALVDEQYRFDSQYCYYSIEENAYYDAETVLDHIAEMPYEENIKQDIIRMLQGKMNNKEQPRGKDFIELLEDLPMWSGFRRLGAKSTHWYEELSRTLNVAYKPACAIKGGVVSVAEKGYLPCSIFRTSRNMVFCILIGLHDSSMYASAVNSIS